MEIDSRYAPDSHTVPWTLAEKELLEPFATNPDGVVHVIRNLPPEIAGALCSRASRAPDTLLKVLLKEYFTPILEGENKELAQELKDTVQFLRTRGFKNILNNQRAQAFYAKWLSQYGDDSIAQMTGTHMVLDGISQVALKFLEDQRVGLEPIEKSTRYVNFGAKTNGKYLYYVPTPDLERVSLTREYQQTLDHLFDTYVALLPELKRWLIERYDDKESVLEKKAFDTLRGLLPMATLGQVALRGNAQAFEYFLNRAGAHELGELRWLTGAMKQELDKEIPSLLLRVDDDRSKEYRTYLAARRKGMAHHLREAEMMRMPHAFPDGPHVALVDYDPASEEKILAGLIFPEMHLSWEECVAYIKTMKDEEREEIFAAHFEGRTARWHKVGRAFENAYLRFDIVMNIGAYRDLHRHRMLTQERERFSTHHGYDVPKELLESGLAGRFESALRAADELFKKIEAHNADLAQYVVPLAYRMRFYQWTNFRELFWETELRTISQGHPDYRWVEQEKYRLVQEKFSRIAKWMQVDTAAYDIARRGTEEKIVEKEKKIVEKLSRPH